MGSDGLSTSLKIDWAFIEKEEGKAKLKGYVPPLGKSGTTIATGVDLGQMNLHDLTSLRLTPALHSKLIPYLGLKRMAAVNRLSVSPLIITKEDSDLINSRIREQILERLTEYFNRDSSLIFNNLPANSETDLSFSALPSEAQTCVASLAFNFGPALYRAIPKTWRLIVTRDWKGLHDKLINFPSKNRLLKYRREREAKLLQGLLHDGQQLPGT